MPTYSDGFLGGTMRLSGDGASPTPKSRVRN